jgi:hypothetical protein
VLDVAKAVSKILGAAAFRSRGFVVCLTPRLVRGTELLLLLTQHIPSTIHPIRRLFLSLPSAIADELTTFFRLGT